MYKEHFSLRELPFSIAPDPRYLYMSEQHREALAHLVYGVATDGGFVLLTGEVGAGKTTVCRCFLEQAPEHVNIAFILNPRVTVEELLASICDELGINRPEAAASNKSYIDRINHYLLDAHAKGKKTVLVIEEAQNLSPDVLEQVRLLTNLETNERKLLQIIMLGQPELRDLLSRPELRQLAQRITARRHLGPLSKKDVPAYVIHRLSVAGGRSSLFPAPVLRRLFRLSGGIPRIVNLLCDRALLGAYVQGKDRVDKTTLSKAAQEVFGEMQAIDNRKGIGWIAAGLAFIACCSAFAAAYYTRWNQHAPSAVQQAAVLPQAKQSIELDELRPPDGLSAGKSRETAYRALFDQWGLAFDPAGKEASCKKIGQKGMRCLDSLGNMGMIRRLNRPVVLKLYDREGQSYYIALTGLKDDTAVVHSGSRELRVSAGDMEKQWFGEYTVIWKAPPDYTREIRPGDRGQVVRWLGRRFSSLHGNDAPAWEGEVYDASLVRMVKKFQLSEGLAPDGVAGPHTIIRLDAAAQQGGPLLSSGKGAL
ncbi:MAG: AAA family ATPase [Nitrospiraceae bacterium]|nr:AAA family ATPase [Nitrospiraceae bacterium]